MTDGFRNRVATNVVPVAQRQPNAFRTGVADGLSAVGEAGQRIASQAAQVDQAVTDSDARVAQIEKGRRISATIADRMGAWPDVQVGIQNQLDDLKARVDPATPDYQAQADRIVTDELTAFRATMDAEPEVLERFAPILATFGASTRQAERRTALKASADRQGASVEKWRDAEGNQLLGDPTPSRLQGLLAQTDLLVDGLDLPAAVRDTYKTQARRGFAKNFLDGLLLKGDWQGVKGVVGQGLLDAYLDPEVKRGFIAQAANGEEAAQREVQLAAGRVRAEALDAAKAIEAKVAAGIVPTPAELRQVRGQLTGAGVDQAQLISFDALSVKAGVNRAYAGRDPMAIRRDRDALAAKMAAGTATEAEQMTKSQLDSLVDNADAAQAEQLKGLVAQGTPGKLQALAMLRGSPEQRHDIAEKVSPGLGAVANLGPRAQAAAINGADVRKARPTDFGKAVDVDAIVKRQLGGAIVGQLGGSYDQVRDVAWNIMAHNLAVNGRAGMDEGVLQSAIATAMGATLRPGGLMQGGVQKVRGRPVWLPSWQTAPEFDRQLSRTDFAGAIYANGAAVEKDDVLTSYRPDYMGDDADGNPLYRLVDAAGGYLRAKAGGAFVVRPRRAP